MSGYHIYHHYIYSFMYNSKLFKTIKIRMYYTDRLCLLLVISFYSYLHELHNEEIIETGFIRKYIALLNYM